MEKTFLSRRIRRQWATVGFVGAGMVGASALCASRADAATFVVNNTNDSGAGSLRAAITSANATAGADIINFSIGSGAAKIQPATPLPPITEAVTINGTTQPGYTGKPLIELNGALAGAGANGLQINADKCVIRTLIINGFAGSGIRISGANALTNNIWGCYIGSDATGTSAVGNNVGVQLDNGASSNIIGAVPAGTSNLISGNTTAGVLISGSTTKSNTVQADRIGTDAGGLVAVPNGIGVQIDSGANNNLIGGTSAGARDIIAGNATDGVLIRDAGSTANKVLGNYIGLDTNGATLPNNTNGVEVALGATNNLIGSSAPGARNIISGNTQNGIVFTDGSTSGNYISANYIGTNAAGTAARPNGGNGVLLSNGANANTVGGAVAAAANLISGNTGRGIQISGIGTILNIVRYNFIGTNVTGSAALPNLRGIEINGAAHGNTIGDASGATHNIISGNTQYGIIITGAGSDSNTIVSNYVGTNSAGTAAVPNGQGGVSIQSSAKSNTIGGSSAATRNLISGNAQLGVGISGNGSQSNIVSGNYIGTSNTGSAALANQGCGVFIAGGAGLNTVGGTSAGSGNVISGNTNQGVWFLLAGTSGNKVQGNYIGTEATGTTALPNGVSGVVIDGAASSNTIGGTVAGARNIIAGNAFHGVDVRGSGTTLNAIQGNYIGLNAASNALPNAQAGVFIESSATFNTVGGTATGSGNIISGNTLWGVFIRDAGTKSNAVQGNYIGTNPGGNAAIPNGAEGVLISGGANTNKIGGTVSGSTNVISGNTGNGITITGSGTNSNTVYANYIGLDATGATALPNQGQGVDIVVSASSNSIGGTGASTRNIISGNMKNGVRISGGTNNFVTSNYIGTDVTGASAVPNQINGVEIIGAATANYIGAGSSNSRNIICSNSNAGIHIGGLNTKTNNVMGNYIGVGPSGSGSGGNNFCGVLINTGAQNNVIGGTAAGAGNVIGNSLQVQKGEICIFDSGSTGNKVQGNYIGVNAAGSSALKASNMVGVLVNSGSNIIGGTVAGARNIIAGNYHGIRLAGSNATNNTVQGNYIGTDVTGTIAIPNSGHGILIDTNAAYNQIGGTATGAGNVISGNGGSGIDIFVNGLESTGHTNIQGNFIGTKVGGTQALPNGQCGIWEGAEYDVIGGTVSGAGNIIAFNTLQGVMVASNALDDAIRGNSIFSNGKLGIDLSNTAVNGENAAGVNYNDLKDPDYGPNEEQNHPVLGNILYSNGVTSIGCSLNSEPNLTYKIDFYSSPNADPSGYGEGKVYLGTFNLTTNSNGNAGSTFNYNGAVGGQYITATATSTYGNTSEFSQAKQAPFIIIGFLTTKATDTNTDALSTALASASNSTITLTFKTMLDATSAVTSSNYQIAVNGVDVSAQAATYDDTTYTVVLQLPKGTLHTGDSLAVIYNLTDSLQHAVSGETILTAE